MRNPSIRLLAAIFSFLLLGGCGGGRQPVPPITVLPPHYELPQVTTHQARPPEGSIFNPETSASIYSDRRASRVGDILLVKIVETSTGSQRAATNTKRDSSVGADFSALFGFEQLLRDKNPRFNPSNPLQLGFNNSFDGDGETRRNSSVTATLSARVIDITMDGNLVIRGYREVRVNHETQHIIVSGLVRPGDISRDNSVLSSYIADARVEYIGEGTLSDKQQPGWLARGLDVLWPF
jgi:flagellar L-ring protein FlgH